MNRLLNVTPLGASAGFTMCLLLVCAPASADSDRIAATVRYLSSLGSRVVGYPGCDSAAAFIEAEFRAMQLERIRREQFEIIIPIDKGGRLRVGEVEIPAHGLWPNLVRTPTVAPEGVHAPMIYGGHGDWTDFDGQEVDGRIVLLEFNSEDRWLHAGALGARAVVFIAPEKSTWLQANEKYVGTPLDLPRYWIDRKRGTALRHQLLQQGELPVSLYGRMDWEERPAWNIVGEITGTDPQLKDELVVVQAYYDGISVVPALAPSAEAAAGIAALLELGRHLRDQPPARSVLLLATSAHFHDRLGTRAFLERHARFTYAERVPQLLPVKLFISLDLSSRSDRLGIWHATGISSLRRFYASFGRRFTTYARQIAPEIGLHPDRALANGISPTRGLEWWNFVPAGMMTDARVAFKGGLVSLLFATVFDERFQLDTPLDLPESVDFENLARQTALLLPMLRRGLNDPKLFTDLKRFGAVVKDRLRYDDRGQSPVLRDQLGDLRVEVRGFPRRSQLPDQPIGDALVVFSWGSVGAKPLKGVRALRYLRTAADGNVTFYGLPYGGGDLTVYGLDPISGDVVLAPDLSKRSQVYNQARPGGAVSVGVGPSSTEKTIVTFAAVPRPVYGLIDPNSLLPMRTLEAFDPAGRAARQFGYAIHGSSSDGVGVVFGPRGSDHSDRLKLVVDGGRMLLTKSLGTESEKRARGVGFLLASESLTPQTDLLGLRDMWRLTESRIQTMRRHVIENQRLTRLHERTRHLMTAAEDAGRELRWSDFVANVREATGTEARAYPDALATLNDVIKGMLFFLALVIPAAFFSERLLVAAADIRRQLLGFAVLLLLVWVVISQIHPAFAIANPLVILLAFAIMAMAVFVLAMVFSRFNRYMRDYRTGDAQVHETDISRGGALYSAFMLGISNMRRRKLRTWLTFITLTLLTSTVLSFSSYKDRIHFLGFELSKRGSYAGALIRDIDWKRLELIQHEYVRSHFGGHALLSPRSWYLVEKAEEGGAIVVNSGPKSARANGLLGLSSVESELTRFDDAVVVGTWFERDDESACLLPSRMAEILGIDADQVGTATVAVFGRELLVRGIVDEERVEQLLDLDGETLTPVDFRLPTIVVGLPDMNSDLELDSELASKVEVDSGMPRPRAHLPPEQVLYMPFQTLMESGGRLRSIAVKFREGADVLGLVETFLERVKTSLFAGLAEPGSEEIRVYSYTSAGTKAIEGLGKLLIPMVIAALIVLNTMLAAVHERSREIRIYSSVGLAPAHIAVLFIAEACVYAVLGITAGYILGQGAGKLLVAADLAAGITLNYSSLAAVASALMVMAVVLLSTFYPARIAAQAAAPDVIRRWHPPPPEGDRWNFQFPFTVSRAEVVGLCGFLYSYFKAYSEESLGTFFTDRTRIVREEHEGGEEYGLQMMIWLAPFDMGVSEYLQIAFAPTEVVSIYSIEIFIQRISGQDAFWKSTNERFMTALRKQFLIWHILDDDAKELHRQTAASQRKEE